MIEKGEKTMKALVYTAPGSIQLKRNGAAGTKAWFCQD